MLTEINLMSRLCLSKIVKIGNARTGALYLLAEHRAVERRLLAELAEHGLSCADDVTAGGALTYETLNRLPFLAAVVKEVLRLYPSAGFTRQVAKGSGYAVLGKYAIPEGVEILIFPHTMHRDGRHWEDALEFKPERWLPRGEGDTASPRHGGGTAGAYLPFSSGARNCVSRAFLSWERSIVTEIHLCHACSDHGVEGGNGRAGGHEPRAGRDLHGAGDPAAALPLRVHGAVGAQATGRDLPLRHAQSHRDAGDPADVMAAPRTMP
eukprot:COSAG01_NODE_10069_length_2256_cov_39.334261_2_plen_266_part_00